MPETPYIPPASEPDALLPIGAVKALTGDSETTIHDGVREGSFPRPIIRQHRCTRWLNADVRAWLRARIDAAASDPSNGAQLIARAKRASEAARSKRTATV